MSEMLDRLKKAILEYDVEGAKNIAANAIEEGIDPIDAVDVAIKTIRQIGDAYGRGELWIPDLVGGASAMKAAMSVLEDELKKKGKKRQTLGSIVIGTVHGDIHDIGKTMVSTLAEAEGFEVIDLGVSIEAENLVAAVSEHNPVILALSALMTTTAFEQRKVIEMLKEQGMRESIKVAVGGGAVTEEFSQSIGADGYAPTAPMAINLFKELIGIGGQNE